MEPKDKNRLDQWLDGALEQYGSAEPREGLEVRILANLSAEKARVPARARWWWVLGTAGATAAVVIVLWLGAEANRRGESSGNLANNPPSAGQKTGKANAQYQVKQPVVGAMGHRRKRPPSAKRVELDESPKLSQFPSPQPLSEQEQILARYVREFPQEAVVVALAQAERQKEMEKLLADETSRIDPYQHER